MSRKVFSSFLLAIVLMATIVLTVNAAAPTFTGTITTSAGSGGFQYTALRAVIQYGSEGKYVIMGKGYPGSLYNVRNTNLIGVVWYYGTSGIMAGNGTLSPTGPKTYSGTVQLFDRKGNVIDTGAVDITFR